jgi:hypothetical protein
MDNSVNQSEKREFLGVWIPKDIYLNKDLSWMEKIILIEVTSFSENGKCFATNQYFAEFLGISASRVRHIIADLIRKGYLKSKIIYKKNSKQVEKRILSVSSTTPPAKSSRTPMAENSHTPPAKSSHYNNIIDNNIDKNNITLSKYRSNIDSNNNIDYNTPIVQSSDSLRYFEQPDKKMVIDLHNKESLAACLDGIVHIPKSAPDHDYLYTLFSAFADTYKKKRRRKHTGVEYGKLEQYAEKLTDFHLTAQDQDIGKDEGSVYHSFSIYDFEPDELTAMVEDYFNYKFDECDYSLHHFMSDSVLKARFWRITNKRMKIAQ